MPVCGGEAGELQGGGGQGEGRSYLPTVLPRQPHLWNVVEGERRRLDETRQFGQETGWSLVSRHLLQDGQSGWIGPSEKRGQPRGGGEADLWQGHGQALPTLPRGPRARGEDEQPDGLHREGRVLLLPLLPLAELGLPVHGLGDAVVLGGRRAEVQRLSCQQDLHPRGGGLHPGGGEGL